MVTRATLLKSTKPTSPLKVNKVHVAVFNQSSMDTCQYCGVKSRAKKPRSAINRHIKRMSAKPTAKARRKHPKMGSTEYQITHKVRKMYSQAQNEEERFTRKSNSDAKYREKRKESDRRKVMTAMSQMSRNLLRPRPMSFPDPTFAELVVYHLPESVQRLRDTDPNGPPNSKRSVLDTYHYEQLQEAIGVDIHVLEASWKRWKETGKYEHGELYRQTLYDTTKTLNPYTALYREIMVGVEYGTSRQQALFEDKWERKGMSEAKADKDWNMWKEVRKMMNFRPEIFGCVREGCNHNGDECLGAKIYR